MKYIIFGASGKMGEMIQAGMKKKGYTLVEGFNAKASLDKKVEADIAIDFSHADFFDEVLSYCISNKIPLMSGTTGLSDTQLKNIKEAANIIPVLWASNTSVGIQFLRSLLAPLKELADWDFHIIESHHIDKLDSPSGTAKTLAEDLKLATGKNIDISALRGGGIFGEHEIRIMGEGETISLKHTALSRKLFSTGAIKAAEFLNQQKVGLYTMSDALGLH